MYSVERALTDLNFEQWIAHVFDHSVRDPQWYFDMDSDYWDGPPATTIAYMTRLFQAPDKALAGFTDAQLNQGFWYLLGAEASECMFALLDESVPLKDRLACIAAMATLFQQLFAPRCSPHLACINEPGDNPLNEVCYMWWDIIPIHGKPDDPTRRDVDNEILTTLAIILELDSIACQESALHGLGHWKVYSPKRVENIIDAYLDRHRQLPKALYDYACHARSGCVQ